MEVYKLEQKSELEYIPLSNEDLTARFNASDKSWWIIRCNYLGDSTKMVCYDEGDITLIHCNIVSEFITYDKLINKYKFGTWTYIRCNSKLEMLTEFAKFIETKLGEEDE